MSIGIRYKFQIDAIGFNEERMKQLVKLFYSMYNLKLPFEKENNIDFYARRIYNRGLGFEPTNLASYAALRGDFGFAPITREVPIGAYRKKNPIIKVPAGKVVISIGFNPTDFRHDFENRNQVMVAILDAMIKVYYFLSPDFGKGGNSYAFGSVDGNLRDYLFPINFFGPKEVERIGRRRILAAPAYKVEELKDGGILLLISPNPFEFQVDPKKVAEFLGLKYG